MKERPILFSGPMVKAILEGRKTQTRRVIKPQPEDGPSPFLFWKDESFLPFMFKKWMTDRCPYGQPGDRLWVRETWQQCELCRMYNHKAGSDGMCWHCQNDLGKWRPSIHMPRWASRINLEIVSVRIERLQEITVEDARAEGCTKVQCNCGECIDSTEIGTFQDLWDSINGKKYPLESNPWVWCLEFKRLGE